MIKVGVIANEKVFKYIEKELDKSKLDIINLKALNECCEKKIDVVVHNNRVRYNIDTEKIKKLSEYAKMVLINSDEDITPDIFGIGKKNVITYGLNPKATITVSSVQDETILMDIQREIINIKNNKIEVGEIKIGNIKNRGLQEIVLLETIKELCLE